MRILCLFIFSLFGFLSFAQLGYWQQRVEYAMEIDFNVKNHSFTGTQELIYYNNSPDTLKKVFYHLYFNAFQPNSMMDVRSRTIEDPDGRVRDRIYYLKDNQIGFQKINSIKQNGNDLSYKIENTIMEVDLNDEILPGASTRFSMKFESQVPIQIRRSGRNNSEGIAYSMAQWFPKIAEYDKKGWHAHPYIAREFYAPWGDYSVKISIDRNYIIGGTGILQNPNEIGYGYEANGTKVKRPKGEKLTWHFIAKNVHDFMWAADPDYVHTQAQVPDGPTLHFFYQPDTLKENWEALPGYAVRAFQYLNENFGKYPYSDFSVVQGGDGGMEYPMSTLITGHRSLQSLVGVTVHEALHSWYQGVLGTNESYLSWMDEGYTSYAASRTMEYLFGPGNSRSQAGSYRGYTSLALSGREEPMTTHADQFETNFAYGRAAYSKGAVSLAQLGYIIGEDALNKTLLRYFDEWKFKHPEMNDFVRIAEKISGLELDWYYDYWVSSTKQIDYAIDTTNFETKINSITLQRKGKMPMPIDLLITKTDGTQIQYYIPLGIMRGEKPNESEKERIVLKDWYWTHPTYTIDLTFNISEIQKIEIDPSKRMADINLGNNIFER